MYYSVPPYHDLIFQDATRRLNVIDPSERRWDLYVGKDFLRARRITDCFSTATQNNLNTFIIAILSSILILIC